MKEKRILLENGEFAFFPKKLEVKAVIEGKKDETPIDENKKDEPATTPGVAASKKKRHNKIAEKSNADLKKVQELRKELDG